MGELGIALIIAALTGISFIAYKHPKAYEKLYPKILVVGGATFLALFAWHISRLETYGDLLPFLETGRSDEIKAVIDSKAFLHWWVIVSFLVCYFYLMFLAVLPGLLEQDDKREKESDDKDS